MSAQVFPYIDSDKLKKMRLMMHKGKSLKSKFPYKDLGLWIGLSIYQGWTCRWNRASVYEGGFLQGEGLVYSRRGKRLLFRVSIQSMMDIELTKGNCREFIAVGYVRGRGTWSTVPGLVSHCELRNTTAYLGFPVECAACLEPNRKINVTRPSTHTHTHMTKEMQNSPSQSC